MIYFGDIALALFYLSVNLANRTYEFAGEVLPFPLCYSLGRVA